MRIKLDNISKKYNDIVVIKNINMEINPDDFIIIYGESGCGKTTLLNIISGLMKPDCGDVKYNENRIDNIQYYLSNYTSYVFQDHKLLNELTVRENIELGIDLSSSTIDMDWFNKLCKKLSIVNILNKKINQISIGQRQRVAIARALIKKPEILLLDEPTGNLDHENTLELLEFLKYIHNTYHMTIVMVSHESSLKEYGNRIWYIKDKSIKEELISNKCYKKIYKQYGNKSHISQIINLVNKYSKKHIIYYLILSLCISICIISFFLSLNVGSSIKKSIYNVASNQETSKIIQLTAKFQTKPISLKQIRELESISHCTKIDYDFHNSYAFKRLKEEKIIITYLDKSISDNNKMIDFFKIKEGSHLLEGTMDINKNEIVIDNSIVNDLKINNPIGKVIKIRIPIATAFKIMNYSEDKTNNNINQETLIPINKNIELDFIIKGVMRNDFENNYTIIHNKEYIHRILEKNVKKQLAEKEVTSLSTTNALLYLDSIDHIKESIDYIENNYSHISCYNHILSLLDSIENIDKVQNIYSIVNIFIFISLIGIMIVINILNYSKKLYFISVLKLQGLSKKEEYIFICLESIVIFIIVCFFSLITIHLLLPYLNTLLANTNPIISAADFDVSSQFNIFHIDYAQMMISLIVGLLLIVVMQVITMSYINKTTIIDVLDREDI